MNVLAYLRKKSRLVEGALGRYLPRRKAYPAVIHEAMRYSVLGGGKRFRPVLVLAAAEACSGSARDAMPAACAIEFFHTYSLIHDDLPCLDNDDYRRGRLSCHRKFGEAFGVLAGDSLLTLGFEVLAGIKDARVGVRLIREISHAIGTCGMIGGQVVDKEWEKREVDLPTLDYINVHKTGQLIRVSCLAGAISARATRRQENALAVYGQYLGLAFQVVDDIMDHNGYMRFMSESEARRKANDLADRAKKVLSVFPSRKIRPLEALADFVLTRKH